MSETPCAYCRVKRNLPPGVALCTNCLQRLDNALRETPWLLTQLAITASKQDRTKTPAQTGGGGAKPQSRPPLNGAATQTAGRLRQTIQGWAVRLEADYQWCHRGPDWERVHAHLDKIRSRTDVEQLTDQILSTYQRGMQIVDLPPEWVLLGRCYVKDCDGVLRGLKGKPGAECRRCGSVYNQNEILNYLVDRAWNQRVPLSVAVATLNDLGFSIRLKTARMWVTRGKLRSPWVSPDGTSLYTVGQLATLVGKLDKQTSIV